MVGLLDEPGVLRLDYVTLMSVVEEMNRPPGGLNSLLIFGSLCNVRKGQHGLDVGCNTGYVAFEFAALSESRMTGLDLSSSMIEAARNECRARDCEQLVDFIEGDAQDLPFGSDMFDFAFSGGSLAFIEDAPRAVREMLRVVKEGAFFGSADFYYEAPPPEALIERLAAILGFRLETRAAQEWCDLFSDSGMEFVASRHHQIGAVAEERIPAYVDQLLDRVSTKFTADGLAAARRRLIDTYLTFNENHEYLGAVVSIARKPRRSSQDTLFSA